ncbi:MAG: hypothetical protein KY475_21875, partial [Planctomycetes bacterium]|nr:hypothetical protein [Planctomycetota bacterium]
RSSDLRPDKLDNNRALDNYRFYANLHTRLFPYIYTYAKASSETGLPIMRPLVLLHQNDPAVRGVNHTYYFGNELLVAPVIELSPLDPTDATKTRRDLAKAKRNIRLPEGGWYDYWTNELHGGGQVVEWTNPHLPEEPHSKLPVFVRQGAIVPMLLSDLDTLCDANYVDSTSVRALEKDPGLLFLIYPDRKSSFTIYDGTNVECEENGTSTAVTLSSFARPMGMNVFAATKPAAVKLNGVSLSGPLKFNQFEASASGWWYDAPFKVVRLKFLHAGGESNLVLS